MAFINFGTGPFEEHVDPFSWKVCPIDPVIRPTKASYRFLHHDISFLKNPFAQAS